MAEFAYTTVPGKIPTLLQKIRDVGVPTKTSTQWLKTIGFTSSNDASLIGVLRQVGLIDASSVPTPIWTQYRSNRHKTILGKAIRDGYAELFAVYADAQSRPNAELEDVFSTSSSAGKQTIGKTVSTFRSLVENADFGDQDSQTAVDTDANPLHNPIGAPANASSSPPSTQRLPAVHIDIQIHIAPEASTQQIDDIFRSMSKHLYGAKD